jgi:endonuclease III
MLGSLNNIANVKEGGKVGDERAITILNILRQAIPTPRFGPSRKKPFEILIMTIISQNTNDKNTERAFNSLSKKFEIVPEVLANAKTSQIEECLRVGGLYRNKAKTIRNVSKIVLNRFHGSLTPILSMPLLKSRNKLMKIPGIGPKTADVLLLFSANQPTIPVDTHVNRVAKRLGLVPEDCNYEGVRENLQLLYNPSDYLDVHLGMIAHGKVYCSAMNPSCEPRPVNIHCPSRGLWDQNDRVA